MPGPRLAARSARRKTDSGRVTGLQCGDLGKSLVRRRIFHALFLRRRFSRGSGSGAMARASFRVGIFSTCPDVNAEIGSQRPVGLSDGRTAGHACGNDCQRVASLHFVGELLSGREREPEPPSSGSGVGLQESR